ncbi:MAG: glycosyltransferase family 9 protein [Nitrospirae bacterium]|nr:glycosyltransferase family 9 protein [Nitrospirota bacterium]
MKTFVHHDGALGDLLLSLPCLLKIKTDFGPLHIAGRTDAVRLLKETGCAGGASSSDGGRYACLYAGLCTDETEEFLAAFDRAFIFTAKRDSPLPSAVKSVIPLTKTVETIPPRGAREHAAEFRLKQLGGEIRDHQSVLEIPSAYRKEAEGFLRGAGYSRGRTHVIALHPGSGGKRKCWPVENYLALAERLLKRPDSLVVIFSGPAEETRLKEDMDGFVRGHERTVHVQDRELALVAALLGSCALYVGNDSGITHLAAAVKTPVIALFGPTDPCIWAPAGRGMRIILQGLSLRKITVDEVCEAIAKVSGPDLDHGRNPGFLSF